jgi:hypothetical protein
MALRFAVALLAAACLAGCDSSSTHKMSGKDVERLLEGKNGPNVICTKGTDGWDYTCRTVRRKIGVAVHEDGTSELSTWTPVDEPLTVGPGREGPAIRARFVDEANAVCKQSESMIGRLPRPVSSRDASARLDQVRDLRFIEIAQLDAIKPPAVIQADYTSMVAGIKVVMDDEMQLGSALASGTASSRRSALRDRRRDAHQANEMALRVGLRACANAGLPLPGITH